MDLSTLPLMPSMDLPPPVEVPVPTAQRPSFDTAPKRLPEREVLDGCFCPSCQEQRERDRTASSMRQQYGSVAVPPTSLIWEGDRFDINAISEFGGQEFRTVTGRIVDRAQLDAAYGAASQPAMASIPPSAPPVQSTQRIRGRYDFSNTDSAASALQDQVRWREPGTLQVWDSPVGGHRQWTYTEELADGTLVDRRGRRWRPTEV